MATKSMMKNVVVRTAPLAKSFIRAVENAEGKKSKEVIMSRGVREIKGDTLKAMFGKK